MNETDNAGDGTAVRLSREEIDTLADDIAVLAAPPPEAAQTTERRGDPSVADSYSPLRRGAVFCGDTPHPGARARQERAVSCGDTPHPGVCAHWLSWRIGVALPAAREKVRAARALGGLPKIDSALERGELSYSKVRALTRVADEHNETLLVDMAKGATGAQLETLFPCRST